MALSVNTNIASLQAQMNLNKASQSLAKNQERLSTGLRINSAADDAAGLAITDRMTAQIRGLNQAAMNANDGISLAKTAEGALDETTNILQRMRELAVQAANDSNNADDRASIQAEIDQLISEVDRIAENTNYNTKTLLDGSMTNNVFQVGANSNETINFGINGAKASDLGTFGGVSNGQFQVATDISQATSNFAGVTAGNNLTALADGALTINGTDIDASKSGDDTFSSTDNAASAIAIAEAINKHSDTTGVTASAEQTEAEFTLTTASAADISAGAISINGMEVDTVTGLTTGAATTNAIAIANAINDSGIEGIEAYANTAGGAAEDGDVLLQAVDGRNIEMTMVDKGNDATTALADFNTTGDTKTVRGQVSLYSNESFEIGGDNPNAIGLSPGGVELSNQLVDVDGDDTFTDLQSGDLVINGYNVDISQLTESTSDDTASDVDPNSSANSIANAINNTEGLSNEVEASAKTVANLGQVTAYDAASGTTMKVEVNGVSIDVDSNIEDGDSTGALVADLNSGFSGSAEGLVASVNDDGELLITSDDGVNVDVNITTAADESFLGNINTTDSNTDVVAKGTVSLAATEGNSIESVEGDRKALAGIANQNGLISNLDVTTKTGAQDAIDSIDEAISQVDSTKANLGAIQNRFESTISNLDNVSQNVTEARSRILDADFAKEAAEMTQNNVRQQAAASVLTQANQNPQLALQLLGG